MSEPENFLTRWSRRKRVAEKPEQPAPAAEAAPQTPAKEGEPVPASEAGMAKPPAPVFDPASLPSLDSIGAETDIRAFLQAGVPSDLRLAALRRAWSSDPAICNFKGLAENDWDFTAPNSMMGFGELGPGVDVKKMLAQMFGETPRETEPPQAVLARKEQLAPPSQESKFSQPPVVETAGGDDMVQREENIAAREKDSEPDEQADHAPVKRRRSQGGALPH
jgi:hypothetical protein